MSTTNNDWTAFPFQITLPNADGKTETTHYNAGMTLRDYFAAKAMQGLMDAAMPMAEIAKEAYQMADLMLKAREK